MARRKAFVAEVAVDFEHLLEAADDQALQVKLGRDTQKLLHIERVVVGDERLGRGAAGDRMHHRCFDFHEAVTDHVIADRRDDGRTGAEGKARFLVHDQVDVTLAILHFLIGQAVEFVRQRAQRFGQQADFGSLHREFARLGLHQGAGDGNDVAQVPGFEIGVDVFTNAVALDIDLDATGQVLDGGERGLAHDALEHHAAGQLDFNRQAFEFLGGFFTIAFKHLGGGILALEVIREGFAGLAPFGQFGAALGDELVFVLLDRGLLFGVGHIHSLKTVDRLLGARNLQFSRISAPRESISAIFSAMDGIIKAWKIMFLAKGKERCPCVIPFD